MAPKKISKNDLQQEVTHLKEKIATLSTRLDTQSYKQTKLGMRIKSLRDDARGHTQVDGELEDRLEQQYSKLSIALSSAQKKLDELQQDETLYRLSEELGVQANRQGDLEQTAEGLSAKIRDLEETTSLVERAADGLRERTTILENSAAEISDRQQELIELTRQLGEQTEILPTLQDKFHHLTADLNRLWAHTDDIGLKLSQQTNIATLLGQSRDELNDRTGTLEKEVRLLSERQERHSAEISRESDHTVGVIERLDDLTIRHQDQALKNSEHDSRIHDLEESSSLAERSMDELRPRTEALESSAAEYVNRQNELLKRALNLESRTQILPSLQEQLKGVAEELLQLKGSTAELGAGLEQSRNTLGDRAQLLEERFKQSSRTQAALEERVSQLFQQAEENAALPQILSEISVGHQELQQSAVQLAAQIEELQNSASQQAHEETDLEGRTRQLETSAAELTLAQQTLQGRTDQLDLQNKELRERLQSDHSEELARHIPQLLERSTQSDQIIEKLGQRTEVLEAQSETLAQHNTELSSQLPTLQQRLSELVSEANRLESDRGKLENHYQSLEQRLSVLDTYRSRLEEYLSRTEALETAAVTNGETTDSILKQLATLTEDIQRLLDTRVEQRLEDLELRGNAQERLLSEGAERISGLEQGSDAITERLNSAFDDAGALEDRVNGLSAGSEQLADEVDRLSGELQANAGKAQQQSEQLQDHQVRLALQEQHVEAFIADSKQDSERVNGKLQELDGSQQTLQEKINVLEDQQAGQETAGRNLQQSLNGRTIFTILALLLISSAVVFLLLRGPAITAGQPEMVQLESAVEQAITTLPGLEQQVGEINQELSRLGASVKQINTQAVTTLPGLEQEVAEINEELSRLGASMDQINSTVAPELPVQVVGLKESVKTLTQTSLQRQQQSEQLQNEVKQITDELDSLKEELTQYPAMIAAAQTPEGKNWLRAQQLGHYTLQLVGVRKRESLASFVRRQGIESDSAIYRAQNQGKKWYVLFYGTYETLAQARKGIRKLPAGLASLKPWVRRIPETGRLFPL